MAEDVERLQVALETPGSVGDYATFRYLTGQLFALRRLINEFDDINKLINSR